LETEFTPFSLIGICNGDQDRSETRVKDRCNARSEHGYGKYGHVI
jgi:hypothetical protein